MMLFIIIILYLAVVILLFDNVESAFHHVGIAPCKPAVISIVEF